MEELINEFGELNKKIEDLKNLVTGENDLDNLNKDLIISQIKAMEAYIGILSIRIGLNNNQESNAEESSLHGQE